MCSLNGPHLPIQRPAPVVTSWSFQESATCSPKSPNAGRKTLIKSAQWKSYDVKGSSGSVQFRAAMVTLRLIGLRKQKRGAQTVWTKFKCLTCELWNSVVLLHPKAFHLDNTVCTLISHLNHGWAGGHFVNEIFAFVCGKTAESQPKGSKWPESTLKGNTSHWQRH